MTDPETLIAFADMIDSRSGPIAGRDADTIALMMRRVARNMVAMQAALLNVREFVAGERAHLIDSFCTVSADGTRDLTSMDEDGRSYVNAAQRALDNIDAVTGKD